MGQEQQTESGNTWETWDRNPSEPNFSDYTYIAYKGEKIATLDVLDYSLTQALNRLEVSANSEQGKRRAINAYVEFNNQATKLKEEYAQKIDFLKQELKNEIDLLREEISLGLKCAGDE